MFDYGRLFPAVLVTLLAAAPFEARATAVCEKLRENLAGSTTVIGSTAEVRRYANAINQQNQEIRRIRSDMRRNGCSSGSIVVFGGDNAEFCNGVEADLKQAEGVKRELMRRRSEIGGTGRSGLIAALKQNGCTEADIAGTALAEPQMDELRTTLDGEAETTLPGTGLRVFGAIARQPTALLPLDGSLQETGPVEGTLRTLCVRTCDGAFFPISSNATAQNFRHDAETCTKMCPGTETELYYHSMRDQESADMISAATGAPYTALPTAFSYRNRTSSKDAACGCNLDAYYKDVLDKKNGGERPAARQDKAVTEIRTVDKPKGDTVTAPDTGASSAITLPEERPYDPATSRVRQVGPQFLGDDSASIDLKNPKGSTLQPLQ